MRSIPGIPARDAADIEKGSAPTNLGGSAEARWIERLQLRAMSAPGPLAAQGKAGSWIDRLQQRVAEDRH